MTKTLKVLFVSSGKLKEGISPLIRNQGLSLQKAGVQVEYFTIKQKGIRGYLNSIKPLRVHLNQNKYDLVHAHYSLSGMVSSMAIPGIPVVVSLMGSDVNNHWIFKISAQFFSKFVWRKTIVKSFRLKSKVNINKIEVIPNGVNMQQFKPMDPYLCREELGWLQDRKHLLFAADPERKDKNFNLVKNAVKLLKDDNFELHVLSNVPNEKVPSFMNAADVVLLSSPAEGSPNVIKEAMACNCPIVSTDVGDVREIFGGIEGCYIAGFRPDDFAENIQKVLAFRRRTVGRDRIYYLDSEIVANKILNLYKETIKN